MIPKDKPTIQSSPLSITVEMPKVDSLQSITGNLELLYIKAKDFHWNVTGPEFRPLHLTFDGIQETALEWADTMAERMRALDIKVVATAARYLKDAWFPEAKPNMTADEMKHDMVLTLKCISAHLQDCIRSKVFDEVTSNQLQDLCHQIDKHNYFVKSSI